MKESKNNPLKPEVKTPKAELKAEKLPNYEGGAIKKEEEWLEAQSAKADQIEALTKDTKASYPPTPIEPFSTNKLKNPEAGLPITIYPKQTNNFFKNTWNKILEYTKGSKRGIAIGVGLMGASVASGQQGPNINQKADAMFANPIKPKIENAVKVDVAPKDYSPYKEEGGKNYFVKTNEGGKLKVAKPEGPKGGKEYTDWIINQLKSGTASPQELVDKKYISQDELPNYMGYYQPPAVDIVYTENVKNNEVDPYAGFAKNGTVIYNPNGQMAAKVFYATKDTKSETDGGMLNTQDQDALVEFFTKDGVSLDKLVIIPGNELSMMTGGNNAFKTQESIDALMARAKDKYNNYTLSSKDVVRRDK